MKAIIMAGGEGTRLRPLTCALPKPMVPLLGKPVMEYSVDLLKRHGFNKITATLMYRPEEISDYFGDSLSYYVEKEPLGTAGGVKRAAIEQGIDGTLLILSGDSLTDIDLTEALGFHRARGATATMVLVRAENPTEFGVVVTERDGRVMRFLEKPSAGEVLSDTINAGIYLLEPEAIEAIPDGKYDFGQDLFPELVRQGAGVYGYVAGGYWCDIGDIPTYMRAHRDAADGRIRGIKPGPGGMSIHPGARIEQGAYINPPCWIDDGAVVRAGARIGPYAFVSGGATVEAGASAVRSILWQGARVAGEARGAVLMNGASLQKGAQAYEGSVVGEKTSVGENAVLAPGALVWPHKQVEAGMRVHGNLVWGGASAELLRARGARGAMLQPEALLALGAAFARAVGGTCAIGECAKGAAHMAADAFASGLMSAGGRAYRLGACAPQSTVYAVRSLELDGGCAVRMEGGELILDLYAALGSELGAARMRALKQGFLRRDAAPYALENIPVPVQVRGVRQQRCQEFAESIGAVGELGLFLHVECHEPTVLREAQEMLSPFVTLVDQPSGVICAHIAPDGESFSLTDEAGMPVAAHRLPELFAHVINELNPHAALYLPADASSLLEDTAASMGVEAVRVRASRGGMLEALLDEQAALWHAVYFDAAAALLMLCAHIARRRVRLADYAASIGDPHMRSVSCAVREGKKAAAMRSLIEDTRGMDVTLDHGMRLRTAGGWALIFPSDDAPEFRVIAEGYSSEAADELAGFCIDLLRKRSE